MNNFKKSKLLVFVAINASLLTACGGGGSSSGSAGVSTALFDSSVEYPADTRALDKSASAPLMYAIQTQGFETEYDQENIYAPHQSAWKRWNLYDYVDDGPYSETRSCADIARYQTGGTGSGTLTVVNTLQDNYVGYVEHRYNNCVINNRVYAGTRRIKIIKEPRDHPSSSPAAKFQWQYENFYWGTDQLNYFLNGVVEFEEMRGDGVYEYYYQSTSNYTFAGNGAYKYAMKDLVSHCEDERNELSENDYSWRCDIQSGHVALDGLGEYSVKTLHPVHQSVWLWGAKLQISDSEDNHLVFWGEGDNKRVTRVDAEAQETTYAAYYNSTVLRTILDSQQQPENPALTVDETRFKQWETELYSDYSGEFFFFNPSESRYVDTIKLDAGGGSTQKRIDLAEPAYAVNLVSEGDTLMSGHDGAVRSINLADPELSSSRRSIGLGKIVEVHDSYAVTYSVPGSYQEERVSYQWDSVNQVVTGTRNLGYYGDTFAYKDGNFVLGDQSSTVFQSDRPNDYGSKHLSLGDNHGYLQYLNRGLVINGGGILMSCAVRCSEDAVYWKSVNEAIAEKYPDADTQIVVAAATDRKDYVSPATILILATKAKADWVTPDNQRNPETADQLWAVDLNDMQRLVKLDMPLNEFSTPRASLEIRELFNRRGERQIVGVGSWNLASGKENTTMFTIDLDKVSFD